MDALGGVKRLLRNFSPKAEFYRVIGLAFGLPLTSAVLFAARGVTHVASDASFARLCVFEVTALVAIAVLRASTPCDP